MFKTQDIFIKYLEALSTFEKQALLLKRMNHQDFITGNNLLNNLCSILILDYFSKNNINTLANEKISKDVILNQLKIKDPYNHFLDYMLIYLIENLYITQKKEATYFSTKINQIESTREIINQITSVDSAFLKVSQLIFHCISNYPFLFSGNISHTNILFPNGNINFTTSFLNEFSNQYFSTDIYFQLIKKLIYQLIKYSSSLSVLEIGAGQGKLSWEILNFIIKKKSLNALQYHFTDISRIFLTKAKKHAISNHFGEHIKFSTLDFNIDPLLQGFSSNTFDVILAFDSLHAAKDIYKSIAYLKNILKKEGLFIILESICLPQYFHFIWGVTPEWWNKSIEKTSPGPLLKIDEWAKILKNNFSKIFTFPYKDNLKLNGDSTMIICQK